MAKSSGNSKDTIYVDVDDEITAIIDKVVSSPKKIVALVLPKRAVVLQSIVNMRLLKSSADDAKKGLVLITSEAGLMPLAGVVGLYIAKSLQSKPSIPAKVDVNDDIPEDVGEALADQEEAEDFDSANNKSRSIGELAAEQVADDADEDSIEIGDDPDESTETTDKSKADKDKSAKKDKKDKKLKVPNFNKFRLWIILGVLAIILIVVGIIFAFSVLPKASVTITTDSHDVPVSKTVTASTKAEKIDSSSDSIVLPAKSVEQTKTQIQKVEATGQKNKGKTASGSITLTAGPCSSNAPSGVPAGTGVSTDNKTFILQEDASFGPELDGTTCTWTSSSVDINAQSAGAKYNVDSGSNFTVAGRSDVAAIGSASGGSDKMVKIVAQSDIEEAKKQISESSDTSALKDQLKSMLSSSGWLSVEDSFDGSSPKVTLSDQIGDEAKDVTVTQVTTYTMVGLKQSDLKIIITKAVKTQIEGKDQQNILSTGASKASFTVLSNKDPDNVQLTMSANATVGPDLNEADIQKMAAGKKAGDIKSNLEKLDGVKNVDVKYSPFWVSRVPDKPAKVSVIIKQSSN